jgi:hypothetical protein
MRPREGTRRRSAPPRRAPHARPRLRRLVHLQSPILCVPFPPRSIPQWPDTYKPRSGLRAERYHWAARKHLHPRRIEDPSQPASRTISFCWHRRPCCPGAPATAHTTQLLGTPSPRRHPVPQPPAHHERARERSACGRRPRNAHCQRTQARPCKVRAGDRCGRRPRAPRATATSPPSARGARATTALGAQATKRALCNLSALEATSAVAAWCALPGPPPRGRAISASAPEFWCARIDHFQSTDDPPPSSLLLPPLSLHDGLQHQVRRHA